MSIRSRKQKGKLNKQKETNHLKDLSCTISQQLTTQSNPGSVTSPKDLVEKLLKLQVDLVSKINDLKQQKISALEEYNQQYDRYSLLSLHLNSNESKHIHEDKKQQDIDEEGLDETRDQLRKQEKQLEGLLAEMYELRTNNDLHESLLTSEQLEQLDYLIKFTHRPIYAHQLSPKSQETLLSHLQAKTTTRFHLKSGPLMLSCMEEIQILKELTEKMMSRKLSYLKSHQQLVVRYQDESNFKVKQTLNNRLFLEKELRSLDLTLNNLKTCYNHHIQHSSPPNDNKKTETSYHDSTNKSNQYSVEKWLKILKYQQLKQRLRQLEHQAQSHEERLHSHTNSRSRVSSTQQTKVTFENPEHNQTIKAKIALYQTFLKQQSHNKLELYTQIKHKKQHNEQILKQNQIMKRIISLSNL